MTSFHVKENASFVNSDVCWSWFKLLFRSSFPDPLNREEWFFFRYILGFIEGRGSMDPDEMKDLFSCLVVSDICLGKLMRSQFFTKTNSTCNYFVVVGCCLFCDSMVLLHRSLFVFCTLVIFTWLVNSLPKHIVQSFLNSENHQHTKFKHLNLPH